MSDISLDYTGLMTDIVGAKHGLTVKQIESLSGRTEQIHKNLTERKEKGEIGFFNLPTIDTRDIKKFAAKIRENYENLIVLGIGGSALGTTAVQTALGHSYSHLLTKRKRNGYPKLFVVDNIDPDAFSDLLQVTDPKKSLYCVISKSGSTAETMAQFMIVQQMLKQKLKGKWKKRIVVITDSEKGPLRSIVKEHSLASFEVPHNVGGRFSVFSAVGLVPLACAGVDIDSLLAGAARMAERCAKQTLMQNPAYLLSALLYLADTEKAKSSVVMMPYSSKLYGIADFFRQLWAESLGKRLDESGKEVYTGQTPIKALGVTDQHSQVQLYVEGPFDKVLLFLEVGKFNKQLDIPDTFPDSPELRYLAGSSLNELMKVENDGTKYALATHNRPFLSIKMPEVSAHTIGQLIYMLELATAFAGSLYQVNPFDQPGVEFGKNYTYAMTGRTGYDDLRAEIKKLSSLTGKHLV